MPEKEGFSRVKLVRRDDMPPPPTEKAPFVELGISSPFSFLRGASDAIELTLTALGQGYDSIGIADRNTLAGVVRMHSACTSAGIRPLIGCRLDLSPSRKREGVGGRECPSNEGVHDRPSPSPLRGSSPPACGRGEISLLAYPIDRDGYGRLSRLLSLGKMRAEKGECELSLADVAAHQESIAFIAWPNDDLTVFERELPRLRDAIPSLRHVAASWLYRGDDNARIERLDRLTKRHGCTILATNDVRYHAPERRPLQDVVTCIREKTTIANAGYLLNPNAERHLKSPDEMVRLFERWPHAIAATREFADSLHFSLDELRYEYPRETVPEGRSPQEHLEHLTWEGAKRFWPDGIPDKVVKQLRYELPLIERLDFARYFLTVHDIVDFARKLDPPILCQGRGSAANSAVCYCLGITAVDPSTSDLLFERFISEERKEPPDIDVDFEHERREEVIQHIYEKYGRDRAGIAATVIHYRPRSAIREVGKVMGLSEDVCAALASTVWGSHEAELDGGTRAKDAGLDLSDPHFKRTVRLAEQLVGMPRHLSQHVGGFILTERPLTETVPIGNGAMDDRTFIEWDKDDIEELGILKIDVLALGMLTCIRKCFDLVEQHHGERWSLATIPQEVPEVYDMLCRGDSLGVFQVESRAQMNMLPRLKPRCFYDLVIEVAIVRPGPIQGDMVHPYLKRRSGREPVTFPCPHPEHGEPDELEKILGRTLGVPIFQEQAMKIALDAARFSSEEANQLRKAMATFRSKGKIETLEEKMVGRMVARGYDPEFAQRCFDQIKGFGEYGFPESHAASFAHLVYVSSWLRWRYPAAFACALLNSQPMGFYAPAQIVRDAREHGVEVREVDVNCSEWDCTLESPLPAREGEGGGLQPSALNAREDAPSAASSRFTRYPPLNPLPCREGRMVLRLGLRQVDGLQAEAAERVVARRPYASVEELQSRGRVPVHAIQRLAAADAFRSMGLDRRAALWDSRALKAAPDLPLFAYAEERDEGAEDTPAKLPAMPLAEHVISDYQTIRLSLKAHPMEFLRAHYAAKKYVTAEQLNDLRNGRRLSMAGVVLIRQRPGTSKGVVFITIEDETGIANLVVWPKLFEKQRKIVMGARLMAVHGIIQRDPDSNVIHVVADGLEDHTHLLSRLSENSILPKRLEKPDGHGSWGAPPNRHPRNVEIIPKSRDFH